MHLSLIPLLPFTITFIAGILLQGQGVSAVFIYCPLILALVAAIIRRNTLSILSLGLVLGFGTAYLATPPPLSKTLQSSTQNYSGVATEVRSYDPTQTIIVRIDSCNDRIIRPFSAKIIIPSSLPTVSERDRIAFPARLYTLDHTPDLPDETDYNAALRRGGCVGQALVSPDSLRIIGPEQGLLNLIRRQREKITLLIARSALSDNTQAFLNAALTGDRSMLTPETREIFSATGLSHILALSGLHVGIITILLSLLLLPLRLTGSRNLHSVIILILLWGFAVMTGLTPSVVRAVIMASVLMLSFCLQRVNSPINSLCLAALLILVFSPHSLYTIGFQLSFAAVAAIIIFAEKLNPFRRRQTVAHTIAAYPAVTAAALLGTGLVSAYYFHIFPLYSIPVNFVSALLLPFIIGGGIILLLLNSLGIHAAILGTCVDSLYNHLLSFSSLTGNLPGHAINGLLVSPLAIVAWLMTLTALALWLYKRRMVYATATMALITFTAFCLMTDNRSAKPGSELYIPRTRQQTTMLIRHNNKLFMASTAHRHEIEDVRANFNQKYNLFMMKRGIDSITVLPIHYNSKDFIRKDNLFVFRTPGSQDSLLTIAMIHKNEQILEYGTHINYAIVCNGFRGDILDVADKIKADTILLSADLNGRRHNRYDLELTEAAIPHRSLRNRGFSITLREAE